ncbi:GntR family transcriptional regulator [Ovoidimarina sediminis]|uniref:GntR family transcriptional regulator n=1 Tax=Ovoidimarina sediminis TaxID=3079856 RepID=UPI00290FD4EE|nr:FCD domain-containing protein [Rhodophyticola sp. MJ-SS7]MDU8944009.1 FCD domain-containing protein [Rhodophyticola sp. MJ-SS7]
MQSTKSPSPVRPDEAETLSQAAYRALKRDIIRGVRVPEERLRIEKLKGIYGIGPTPLREALQKLSQDGLVLSEGNRGFAVAPLDPSEFADLNLARTAIEKEALRLAIEKGDDAWEARIVAASYIMRKEDMALPGTRGGVPDSWERANTEFHEALVAACGSAWLLKIREGLQELCERYRRASVYQELGSRNLGAEHAEIAEAVLARDTERACALTERHFALTAASLTGPESNRAVAS